MSSDKRYKQKGEAIMPEPGISEKTDLGKLYGHAKHQPLIITARLPTKTTPQNRGPLKWDTLF